VRLDGIALSQGPALPGWSAADGRVEARFEDDGGARSLELEPAP
jgi:hypothetical protein